MIEQLKGADSRRLYHQIADQLRERRETLGVSYITVFEKDIAAMSDVVELLKG